MNKGYEKIIQRITDLQLLYLNDNSNYIIRQYGNQIDIYQRELDYLKDNKPFSFQKKKMKDYNDLIDYYTMKIIDLNKKIEDEITSISTTYLKSVK